MKQVKLEVDVLPYTVEICKLLDPSFDHLVVDLLKTSIIEELKTGSGKLNLDLNVELLNKLEDQITLFIEEPELAISYRIKDGYLLYKLYGKAWRRVNGQVSFNSVGVSDVNKLKGTVNLHGGPTKVCVEIENGELIIHVPKDADTTNWYHSVTFKETSGEEVALC